MRLKVKYVILLSQLVLLLLLMLKMKYLLLVIQSKKLPITQNLYHNHDKYITTLEFDKFTAEIFALRLKRTNLVGKSDIANLVNKTYFDGTLKNLNKKITSNKTKNVLVENEFKKLQTFNSSLSIGQSYFNNDGAELYLKFQPIYKTITTFPGLKNTISEWESKGLLNEKSRLPYTVNKVLPPKML